MVNKNTIFLRIRNQELIVGIIKKRRIRKFVRPVPSPPEDFDEPSRFVEYLEIAGPRVTDDKGTVGQDRHSIIRFYKAILLRDGNFIDETNILPENGRAGDHDGKQKNDKSFLHRSFSHVMPRERTRCPLLD